MHVVFHNQQKYAFRKLGMKGVIFIADNIIVLIVNGLLFYKYFISTNLNQLWNGVALYKELVRDEIVKRNSGTTVSRF